MRLEDIISELQQLAKLRPLRGEQQLRARQLLSELKRRGFPNAEISRLTGWDESTIKQKYTRGVVAVGTAEKDRAIDLLAELPARGLTLDSVEAFLPLKADLDDRNVKSDEVAALLQEMRTAHIQAEELARLPGELKRVGLSLAQLKEALSTVDSLGKLGYTFENLHAIMEAARSYDEPNEFIKAVAAYDSLAKIEAELKILNAEKEEREKTISALDSKIQELNSAKQKIQDSLDLVVRLEKDGIDEPALKNVADISARHGGVKGVLAALNGYADLDEINSMITAAKAQLGNLETDIKHSEAKFAHLSPVVKVVDILIYEFNFSRDSIIQLYKVAKIHGNPVEVFDALGKFGDIKALEARKRELSATVAGLEARVGELEAQIQELRSVMDEIKKATTGILGPFAGEVAKAIGIISSKYEEYAEKVGRLRAQLESMDNDVVLAKIILSVERYPTTAKNLPFDYILLLASALKKVTVVRRINPTYFPGDDMLKKYGIYKTVEFELQDMLDWVGNCLMDELKKQ